MNPQSRPGRQYSSVRDPRRGNAPPPPPVQEEQTPEEPPFFEGDVVRLRSGGPLMTVGFIRVPPGRGFLCLTQWFHEAELHTGEFNADCLMPVSDTASAPVAKPIPAPGG